MPCRGEARRHMGAAAAALAVAVVGIATVALPGVAASGGDCEPMDFETYNVSHYIRWSETSDRLYLENSACVTLTDIWESRRYKSESPGPVYPFNDKTNKIVDSYTGSWYLASSLYITGDSKLVVKGTSLAGGDCDHLLLASNANKHINVRAHGGNIWIEGTHVESWDMHKGGVDEDVEDGRSYISAISEIVTNPRETCDGMAKKNMGEARLDILDSEINHLGFYDSESYGIAYKVRGFCKDLSNPEVFDSVGVTGDILRSHIHHLYFGHYSYGHDGGVFSYNEVHDNIGYGFDPHDDSDDLTIHNNHVYNNGWHGIIASKRCDHVSIQNNVVHDNGKNGLMLHRSCDFATVKNNTAYGNLDAGLALYESSNCVISGNSFYWNKYGMRFSMGSSENNAFNNHIVVNGPDEKYAVFLYRGSDVPAVEGSDGRPRYNQIHGNSLISDDETIKMMDSDDNSVEDNIITGRRSRFKDAVNNLWRGNTEPDVYEFKMQENSCFDADSDIEAPADYAEDKDYSYDMGYEDGFFCSM